MRQAVNLDIALVAMILDTFSDRYLNKFTKQIEGREAEVVAEWSKELAGLTSEQVKAGMKWRDEWPPTVYEFYDLCVGKKQDESHIGPAYKQYNTKLIGSIKANPEVSKPQMNKIKAILNM